MKPFSDQFIINTLRHWREANMDVLAVVIDQAADRIAEQRKIINELNKVNVSEE